MMTRKASSVAPARKSAPADSRFGFWAALGTGVTTLITAGTAIATPPLSGPMCKDNCFTYPYLDIGARFPRDYIWMFPALIATVLYVAFMLALQARAKPEWRLLGQLGVVLSVMAGLTILADYFLQLAVIQPSVLAGEADGVSLLTQYNPHGIFIGLEELGYLLMSASMACMAPTLSAATRRERTVRWLFIGGLVVSLAALAWFMVQYGHRRAYLFEVTVITIVWLTLIPSSFAMAAVFRRDLHG